METSYFLGQPPRVTIPNSGGWNVWLGSDVQNTVVFLGFADSASPGGIAVEGTGFLVAHDSFAYVVTARHVAKKLGSRPFHVRVNKGGVAELVYQDGVKWFAPDDLLVDIAIASLGLSPSDGYDAAYVKTEAFLTPEKLAKEGIDVGDICYTVGLFRFVYGQKRNLPLVHTGNIALLPPPAETIPVGNDRNETEYVEAYLIESHAIDGASGSPVFTRASFAIHGEYTKDSTTHEVTTITNKARVHLLGLFQGAWFLPPDAILGNGIKARRSDVVPVGLGIVVPAYKILELLERDDMKRIRSEAQRKSSARLTTVSAEQEPPSATDENPNHRGDFTSLVNAAARKQKPAE